MLETEGCNLDVVPGLMGLILSNIENNHKYKSTKYDGYRGRLGSRVRDAGGLI